MSIVNLKDYISNIESGKRPKGGAEARGIPSLGGEHLNPLGGFNLEKMKYVSEGFFYDMKSGIINKNDIIIVKDGATTGKASYVDQTFPIEKACINEHCFILRAKDAVIPKYLFYYLYSNQGQNAILKDFRGATIGGITKNFIDMPFYLPNKEVQEYIIKVLDKVALLIEERKKQIEACDELIKSRFIEMFGDPISNPKKWDKHRLADRCDIVTGNTPSRSVPEYYGSHIEWIKSDNINTPSSYLTEASESLSEAGLNVGRSVSEGSILMTCIAGSLSCIGNVAIADRKVAFNQQINAIVPKNENTLFMFQLFEISKPYIQSTINMALKGILSKSQLSELEFIFPPLELQNEFSTIAEQVDKSKMAIQKGLEELEILKKALMQQYFG